MLAVKVVAILFWRCCGVALGCMRCAIHIRCEPHFHWCGIVVPEVLPCNDTSAIGLGPAGGLDDLADEL